MVRGSRCCVSRWIMMLGEEVLALGPRGMVGEYGGDGRAFNDADAEAGGKASEAKYLLKLGCSRPADLASAFFSAGCLHSAPGISQSEGSFLTSTTFSVVT